jgi:hypothetical protein
MNVADQFVIGVVELGERHNQKHREEYHKSKPAKGLNHDGHELNTATKNENCGSKGYRIAEMYLKIWLFGGAW